MIIGKQLIIDGISKGKITHYHEWQDDKKIFFRIETISGSASFYFYISDYASAILTDKEVIINTYITR